MPGPVLAAEILTVEAALIAAYQALKGRAFYRLASMGTKSGLKPVESGRTSAAAPLAADTARALFLEAAQALAEDETALAYLLEWARRRAWRDMSFGEACRAKGWRRSSAEAGRRRGAEKIALARLSQDRDPDRRDPKLRDPDPT